MPHRKPPRAINAPIILMLLSSFSPIFSHYQAQCTNFYIEKLPWPIFYEGEKFFSAISLSPSRVSQGATASNREVCEAMTDDNPPVATTLVVSSFNSFLIRFVSDSTSPV